VGAARHNIGKPALAGCLELHALSRAAEKEHIAVRTCAGLKTIAKVRAYAAMGSGRSGPASNLQPVRAASFSQLFPRELVQEQPKRPIRALIWILLAAVVWCVARNLPSKQRGRGFDSLRARHPSIGSARRHGSQDVAVPQLTPLAGYLASRSFRCGGFQCWKLPARN